MLLGGGVKTHFCQSSRLRMRPPSGLSSTTEELPNAESTTARSGVCIFTRLKLAMNVEATHPSGDMCCRKKKSFCKFSVLK